MPRVARIYQRAVCYHVLNRGVNGHPLFADDEDREYFSRLVREYKELCGAKVYHWVWMGGQRQLFLPLTTITFPQWRQLHFSHKAVGNRWLADTLGGGKNQGIILPHGGGSPGHFVAPPFCFRSLACCAR